MNITTFHMHFPIINNTIPFAILLFTLFIKLTTNLAKSVAIAPKSTIRTAYTILNCTNSYQQQYLTYFNFLSFIFYTCTSNPYTGKSEQPHIPWQSSTYMPILLTTLSTWQDSNSLFVSSGLYFIHSQVFYFFVKLQIS